MEKLNIEMNKKCGQEEERKKRIDSDFWHFKCLDEAELSCKHFFRLE
jgi:hypothetical protein